MPEDGTVRHSLAYRKNEAAILNGEVPEKYTRLLSHITGERILELGSAEGVLACLLAKQGKQVTAIERRAERHQAAGELAEAWGISGVQFLHGDIAGHLGAIKGHDALVAVRMIYYLRGDLDTVFSEVAKHIPNVVLCGNRNRADAWRAGKPHAPLGDFNRYAAIEGMTELLERHGYKAEVAAADGDEIVVGSW